MACWSCSNAGRLTERAPSHQRDPPLDNVQRLHLGYHEDRRAYMMTIRFHPYSLLMGILIGLAGAAAWHTWMEAEPRIEFDFLQSGRDRGVAISGVGAIERDDLGSFRWAYGPETVIQFLALSPEHQREHILAVRFENPIPGQEVQVLVNGSVVRTYRGIDRLMGLGTWVGDALAIVPRSGLNTIVLRSALWNGNGSSFAGPDTRPLALNIRELTLRVKR